MEIGEKIRIHRRSLKMKQRELAYKAGITPRTLCRIEKGEMNPSMVTLDRICDAMDADIRIVAIERQK